MARRVDGEHIREELVRALEALVGRTHETAYVLLEDRATEKFVQFGRGPELVLDLPLIGLSEVETVRARDAFAELGTSATRTIAAGDVDGESLTRIFQVLQRSFGSDAEA